MNFWVGLILLLGEIAKKNFFGGGEKTKGFFFKKKNPWKKNYFFGPFEGSPLSNSWRVPNGGGLGRVFFFFFLHPPRLLKTWEKKKFFKERKKNYGGGFFPLIKKENPGKIQKYLLFQVGGKKKIPLGFSIKFSMGVF